MITPGASAALNPHGLDFDRFLYAPVGDDQQGGLLSVISALARVGVDPWDEAAALAKLPLDAAAQALSALLARLPAGSGKPADPGPVAARLVALLPRGVQRSIPIPHNTARIHAVRAPDYRLVALACAACLLLILIGQMLMRPRASTDISPPDSALPASDTMPTTRPPASR